MNTEISPRENLLRTLRCEDAIRRHVKGRFADARAAGHVIFHVGGSRLTYDAMKTMFEEAEKRKRMPDRGEEE